VGHPKIISTQISEQKILTWFLSHNIPKRNKLAEKRLHKNPEYMLNYSLTCSSKTYLSSFWKQKKFLLLVTAAILNGGRSCRIQYWKGTNPRTILAKFALIWFSGFRGEDLNVIFYQNMSKLKSDSTHHFFRNACTKSGSLRFSQFSGCWLMLSVYILMSFDFPFVRLLGVR
jgi:hypothetical protein